MSRIEWTDESWNPVRGCSRVSAGCMHCYAERMAARFARGLVTDDPSALAGCPTLLGSGPFHGFAEMTPAGPRWTGRVELIPEKLDEPLHWTKPRRVFVNSMSDLFHEALDPDHIADVFGVMARAKQHTFQVLTKRPERMRRLISERGNNTLKAVASSWSVEWPLPNVWLGVSPHDQQSADVMIPLLLQTPAAVRFVSLEPLLGPITLQHTASKTIAHRGDRDWLRPWAHCDDYHQHSFACEGRGGIGWVIVGGESGPGARRMELAWARSVRDQCREAGIAFFFKQGGHAHRCIHSAKGGHLECIHADLRVREFPR